MKREERIRELELKTADCVDEIAVRQTLIDIKYALTATANGEFGCVLCTYERRPRRFDAEMRAWEEKNGEMLDRWLWWSGHVLLKTVPKGASQYWAGPWPTDPQCNHDF